MHITELHMVIGLVLVSALLISGAIIFRKTNGMVVKPYVYNLRTASWALLGFCIALSLV